MDPLKLWAKINLSSFKLFLSSIMFNGDMNGVDTMKMQNSTLKISLVLFHVLEDEDPTPVILCPSIKCPHSQPAWPSLLLLLEI